MFSYHRKRGLGQGLLAEESSYGCKPRLHPRLQGIVSGFKIMHQYLTVYNHVTQLVPRGYRV